jgi:hypothetical protein
MPAPLTTVPLIRAAREQCEAEILQLLTTLCAGTGGSLEGVTVRTAVTVPDLSPDSREQPVAIPFAVKIVLGF